MNSQLLVIFGTGPVGLTLTDQLLARGHRVRLVNRSGKAQIPDGVELIAADATDATAVKEVSQGASVLYHCANVPYEQQYEILPRMQSAIIAGAESAQAKLIVTDTLYMYGITNGQPITDQTEYKPNSRKGQLRAQLAKTYLQAHQDGKIQVALGRAADFFGPRVLNSALGQYVFPGAVSGGAILGLGNIDMPHSYSYIEDVARGLATLSEREEALGKEWLLPVAPTVTTRQIYTRITELLGHPVEIKVIEKLEDGQAFGLFDDVFMREFGEMFYQYLEPQIVDARRFEETFGWQATPLDEALRATIDWYRAQ